MVKQFNVNGRCYSKKHYMVNLEKRLGEIKQLVDTGDYFVINRARQYGKTTTLMALAQYLKEEYAVIFMSFQELSEGDFQNEYRFVSAFARRFVEVIDDKKVDGINGSSLLELKKALEEKRNNLTLSEMFRYIRGICATATKQLVLIIDEVDSASNNRVFMDFLAQLRARYLDREETPTFQSVILAGVYDIKNLKLKMRPDEEHRYNSPWNIAAKFSVDMSFSINDIEGMLADYENDWHTEMNIAQIAGLIYEYTSGYPYLVSYICKMLDEAGKYGLDEGKTESAWTEQGVLLAVKNLLKESNTLFEDMVKKLDDNKELRDMLYAILFNGKSIPYNPDSGAISIGTMLGFIKEVDGMVAVANRIFETRLYNLFLSEELLKNVTYQSAVVDKNQFIQNGFLNMGLVLEKFVKHFSDVYRGSTDTFVEENGRRLFLLYLKPIINGVGNYYVEARTRDMRRTDIVVDYRGKQYIIEMKIWHGEEYNRRGVLQLSEYLDCYHLKEGYLLSFNFNKSKRVGVNKVQYEDKIIWEAVV